MRFFPVSVSMRSRYYENLPEFMHYDSTLLVTAEELADRKDVASVQSSTGLQVLIKAGVEESSVIP